MICFLLPCISRTCYSFSLTFEHDANEFSRESQQAVAKFKLDPATSVISGSRGQCVYPRRSSGSHEVLPHFLRQFLHVGARVHRYTTHPSKNGRSILTIVRGVGELRGGRRVCMLFAAVFTAAGRFLRLWQGLWCELGKT